MPSPIYAIDIIKTAMRKKGILAEGQTPTAQQTIDGLRALNDVLETWSVQPYAVWGELPLSFQTIAGRSTYTVGPGGDWNTDRPSALSSMYATWQGVDSVVTEWTLEQYMGVPIKSQRGYVPERFVFINDAPLARVILYPTPMAAAAITISSSQILTQVADVSTLMVLPPLYARALQFAVAEEIGIEYGSPIDLSGAARSSLALIKRANRSLPVSSFDSSLTGRR